MKVLIIAAATILMAFATSASAQNYYAPSGDQECWNPNAGHFERVRPGERQGDLDYRRCRAVDTGDRECYNPRNKTFERVRPGETQNDLDFNRCHYVGYALPESRPRPDPRERRQECWNPRARHYEEVRRGESQDDLDFDRCRLVR